MNACLLCMRSIPIARRILNVAALSRSRSCRTRPPRRGTSLLGVPAAPRTRELRTRTCRYSEYASFSTRGLLRCCKISNRQQQRGHPRTACYTVAEFCWGRFLLLENSSATVDAAEAHCTAAAPRATGQGSRRPSFAHSCFCARAAFVVRWPAASSLTHWPTSFLLRHSAPQTCGPCSRAAPAKCG
jgi:hypothetical protein